MCSYRMRHLGKNRLSLNKVFKKICNIKIKVFGFFLRQAFEEGRYFVRIS